MSCIEFEAIEITPRLNISYIVHATIHASMPPLEIFLNPNVRYIMNDFHRARCAKCSIVLQ